jgi:hypothetical protein
MEPLGFKRLKKKFNEAFQRFVYLESFSMLRIDEIIGLSCYLNMTNIYLITTFSLISSVESQRFTVPPYFQFLTYTISL